MSSVKLAKRFPAVLDKAKFLTKDQIVSIQNVQAGQHIILGRSIKNVWLI